jgi:tetratricopeptide (TPR) repeat protein
VQRHAGDFEAWLGLAQARAELGRDREAVAAFTRALAANANSVPALLERGECYLRLDEPGKADADFAAATRLDAAAASSWHKGRLLNEPPWPDAGRALLYHLRTLIEAKQTPASELPLFLQQRASLFLLLGRDGEAMPDLHRLLELQPSNATALFQRGEVYSRLGQREQAAADFLAALELGPDLRDPWSPARARLDDELNRWEDVFAKVARLHPKDRQLWLGRAFARIRQGQWRSAAESMTRVIELDPSNPTAWFFDAPLRLVLEDSQGYRRDCREMLQRFGQTDSAAVADQTAKTCLLQPEGANDLQPVLRLAERAVTNTEGNIAYPWFLTDRALADYREGAFARAIARLKKVRPLSDEASLQATVCVLLAMAHHRRNQASEARAALDEARKLEEDKLPKLDRGQRFDKEWHNWLRFRVLRHEAETLIAGPKGEAKK